MDRPETAAFLAMSLDGYIAGPKGGLEFLSIVAQEGEDYGFRAFSDSVDAIAIGRNTWETVCAFPSWPFDGKRVIVATRRPGAPTHGEELTEEAPAILLTRLHREGVRRLYVDGGKLVSSFLAARILDELTVSIVPIVLGEGTRLFATGVGEQRLVRTDVRMYDTGLVRLTYRPG